MRCRTRALTLFFALLPEDAFLVKELVRRQWAMGWAVVNCLTRRVVHPASLPLGSCLTVRVMISSSEAVVLMPLSSAIASY